MIKPDQNAYVLLYAAGILPTLDLSSDEVNTLTAEDVALLRELGAGEPLLERLRELARTPGRCLRIDFAQQEVTMVHPDEWLTG